MVTYHIPFFKRLTVRLSLVLIALLSLFVVTSLWMTWQFEKRNVENNLMEDMRETLLIAQGALSYSVWSYDKESVVQLTSLLAEAQKDILAEITIVDESGETLYHHENAELKEDENQKTLSADLMMKSEVVGQAIVSFSPRNRLQHLNHYTGVLFVLSFIVIAGLSLIVWFTSERLVAAPFRTLIENVKIAEEDPCKYPADDDFSGELHALSQSFHHAMQAIHQRDQHVKAFSQAKLASLGEMAAGIAHEINNPLTVIDAKAHTLRSLIDNNGEKALMHQQVERIQAMVSRTSKIIKGLRAFACDGSKDPMGMFSVQQTISDSLNLCQSMLVSKNVELEIEYASDFMLYGQQVQISHAVFNLVQNAIDAVHREERPRIRILVNGDADFCSICVEDNGPGVPENIKDKIFQPFFTTKSVDQGTGLGLSVTHGIAKHHQGKLKYHRTENRTQFIMELPAKPVFKHVSQAA